MPVAVDTYPTIEGAGRALSEARSARIMGGGTILMRAVNDADPAISHLIRTTDAAFTAIRVTGAGVSIGAGVTMAMLAAHPDTAFLAPVARVIGGPQVRSAATVAGNLFAERPYGDLAGALIALDAVAELSDGRRLPVDEVVRQQGTPMLVSALHVPRPRVALRFKKVARVKPKGVSVMSIAALVPEEAGRVVGARIVFTGMGRVPLRAMAAEAALSGGRLEAAAIAEAARVAAEGLEPFDDALATAWYRREVAGVHLSRLLEERR